MPPPSDEFMLRLPPHSVAPSSPPSGSEMPNEHDTAELIRLLKKAEVNAGKVITQGALDAAVGQTNANFNKVAGTIMEKVVAVEKKVDLVADRVDIHDSTLATLIRARSHSTPMPRSYDPEETSPGGHLKVRPDEWLTIQDRIATIEKERDAERDKTIKAQERQAAIEEYARGLETKATKRTFRAVKIVAALTPLLLGLGAGAAHFWEHSSPPNPHPSSVAP